MLDRMIRMALLLDFYGALLTPKQRLSAELYYHQDMSLAEIARYLNISRQAVHDLIHRAQALLEDYERRLGLIEQSQSRREAVNRILVLLEDLEENHPGAADDLAEIRRLVSEHF